MLRAGVATESSTKVKGSSVGFKDVLFFRDSDEEAKNGNGGVNWVNEPKRS